jgi:hypothetical protein
MVSITANSTLQDVAAIVSSALEQAGILGFVHTGVPRFSQFSHPLIEWYVEFPPTPISFGHLHVTHKQCATIEFPAGKLRIVTPTQSVMDRLAAAFAWKDAQSREQAILVAASQEIDWQELRTWFANEGETDEEFERFRAAVNSARQRNT